MISDRYEIAQNYFLFGTSNGKIIDYFTQPTLKTVPKLEPHLEVCEISLRDKQNIQIRVRDAMPYYSDNNLTTKAGMILPVSKIVI